MRVPAPPAVLGGDAQPLEQPDAVRSAAGGARPRIGASRIRANVRCSYSRT